MLNGYPEHKIKYNDSINSTKHLYYRHLKHAFFRYIFVRHFSRHLNIYKDAWWNLLSRILKYYIYTSIYVKLHYAYIKIIKYLQI